MDDGRRWFIIGGIVVIFFALMIYIFFESLVPLFIAFGLAYAVNPIVDFMERCGVRRSITIITLLFLFCTMGGGILFILVPKVASDLASFFFDLPDHLARLLDKLILISHKSGIGLEINKQLILDTIKMHLQGITLSEIFPVIQFLQDAFTNTISFFVNILKVLVIPVFFFYFLRDIQRITQNVFDIVPQKYFPVFVYYINLYDNVLSGFIRGQIFVALMLAVFYGTGLSIVDIPFGVVIGIFSGLFNIVPYLGVLFGLISSLIVVALDFRGWQQVIGVLGVFGIIQTIDGLFVTPRLVGNKVGLSPIQTILALMMGGKVAGISGMLLSIPIFGIVKITLKELFRKYKLSNYYLSR